MFDITAAGHILSTETVADGIREVEEELGIDVDLTKLHAKGVVQNIINLTNFIDREFSNVFLYESVFTASDFSLQQEEVESVHVVERQALVALFVNEVMTVKCVNTFDGTLAEIGLIDFVPHERNYFEQVAHILKE